MGPALMHADEWAFGFPSQGGGGHLYFLLECRVFPAVWEPGSLYTLAVLPRCTATGRALCWASGFQSGVGSWSRCMKEKLCSPPPNGIWAPKAGFNFDVDT